MLYGWIGLFSVLIFLPTFQNLTGAIQYQQVSERRKQTALQPFSFEAFIKTPQNTLQNFENFYNDSYGTRDLLIRAKYQLYYTLFKTTDRIHIGAGNWLFYRSVIDKDQVKMERSGSATIHSNVTKLYRYLRKKGIQLAVVSTPLKNTFYPDKVPASVPDRPGVTVFQKYRQFLDRQNGLIHIDTQKILTRVGKKFPIFHRTDFHWNGVAGFHVGKALVNTLAKAEGMDGELWSHPLKVQRKELIGGQANFIPMLKPLKESAYYAALNCKQAGKFAKPAPKGFKYRYQDQSNSAPKLPTTVFYGDSFTYAMTLGGFFCYFEDLFWADATRVSIPELVKNLPADVKYVVIQRIETGIPTIFGKPMNLSPE